MNNTAERWICHVCKAEFKEGIDWSCHFADTHDWGELYRYFYTIAREGRFTK